MENLLSSTFFFFYPFLKIPDTRRELPGPTGAASHVQTQGAACTGPRPPPRRPDLDKSIQFLERALELNPDFASAQENLGIAFAMKGRVDEAISHLNRAHELDPTNQRILKNLAMAYHQKGDVANESKVRQLLQE